jgi:diguanylate cyclase (GGDEF)-like protein/PAS domain S-box-containing protein
MPTVTVSRLLVIAPLALVYFLAAKLGLMLAYVNTSTTAVWPAAGIALAALLVLGYGVWPGIFLGALLANATLSSIPASVMIACGNTAEALLAAYLINRFAKGHEAFDRPLTIFRFAALGGLVAPAIGATIGTTSLAVTDDYRAVWFTWWLGDGAGTLIVAPLLLLWVEDWRCRLRREQLLEFFILLLSLIVIGLAVFERLSPIGLHNYPAQYLVIPVVVWVAFRYGRREAVTATVILCGISIWGTLHGFGAFAGYPPNASLLLLDGFMATVTMIVLILGAAVAERRRVEQSLRESEERHRLIAQTAADAIITVDKDCRIATINAATERIFGYRSDELVGKHWTILIPEHLREHTESIGRQLPAPTELAGLHKDGTEIPLEASFGQFNHGENGFFTAVMRDITERKRAEDTIRHLAQHDPLTGLPNRMLCCDRIDQAIAQARRSKQQVALLFLDLDHFKLINDSLGHHIGDRLLRLVARRLQNSVREGDSVARLGGDEFVICVPSIASANDALAIAGKLLQGLREPFLLDERELHVSGSIGVGLYPSDGTNAETLMRAADSAMYHAKENDRDNYQFFTPSLKRTAERWIFIANRLHKALDRREFMLNYQPQVELTSGRVIGVEALLRWHAPGLGDIPPSEFVKVAEQTGAIVLVGEWVLREACAQLKRWRESGTAEMRVAVNMSPQQLRQPGLVDLIARILDDAALPAALLEIEITEGILVTNSTANLTILKQLADLGVSLAIDDFGTGYSSLAYLKRFPIHCLKIDQSFVDGIGRDTNDPAIVTAVIALAHSLGLKTVGEGVERLDQVDFLRAHGCDSAQGLYYCAPTSAEALHALFDKRATLSPGADEATTAAKPWNSRRSARGSHSVGD